MIKRLHSIHVAAFAGLIALAACDNKGGTNTNQDQAGSGASSASAPAAPKREPDPSIPEKTVEITGNDMMKFDVMLIEAKPNQKVTVTLSNVGSMPKVSMGHNFVLLQKGTDPNKFVEAGTPHMGKDYIAPEYADKVIASTKLLGPGEKDTVSFAAPAEPGDYEYICSFPGHYAIGMKGILKVQ